MFENNCRLCGSSVQEQLNENLLNLFNEKGSKKLLRQIKKLTGLLLKNEENMPELICGECQNNLENALYFRKVCIETQTFWKRQIKKCQVKAENEILSEAEKSPQWNLVEVILDKQDELIDVKDEALMDIDSSNQDSNPLDGHQIFLKSQSIDSPNTRYNSSNSCLETSSGESDSSWTRNSHKKIKTTKKILRMRNKQLPYICELCGTQLKFHSHFQIHMRRHNGERIFECDLCTEKFFAKADLNTHKLKHNGEKPFQCRFCESRFLHSSGRTRHERMHTNDRPFVCVECGARFTTGYVLKNHMLKHTGERNFNCALCQRAFQTQSHLNNHNRSMFHKQNELKQNENVTDCDPKSLSIVS